MKTDNIVRVDAMNALIKTLGEVDTGRFISMVKRDIQSNHYQNEAESDIIKAWDMI